MAPASSSRQHLRDGGPGAAVGSSVLSHRSSSLPSSSQWWVDAASFLHGESGDCGRDSTIQPLCVSQNLCPMAEAVQARRRRRRFAAIDAGAERRRRRRLAARQCRGGRCSPSKQFKALQTAIETPHRDPRLRPVRAQARAGPRSRLLLTLQRYASPRNSTQPLEPVNRRPARSDPRLAATGEPGQGPSGVSRSSPAGTGPPPAGRTAAGRTASRPASGGADCGGADCKSPGFAKSPHEAPGQRLGRVHSPLAGGRRVAPFLSTLRWEVKLRKLPMRSKLGGSPPSSRADCKVRASQSRKGCR